MLAVSLATQGFSPAAEECVTEDGMWAAMGAWAGAIVAIGNAWVGDMTDGVPDMNCAAALKEARGALDAAYAYKANSHSDPPVLFKPTVATEPSTFRNTYAGALSYFVGACSDLPVVPGDNGFAFAYTALPEDKMYDKKYWLGWKHAEFHKEGPGKFQFLAGGPFCEAGIAQGKLTLTARYEAPAPGGSVTVRGTVDKTFSYIKGPEIPLLVVHHSSSEVAETSDEAKKGTDVGKVVCEQKVPDYKM